MEEIDVKKLKKKTINGLFWRLGERVTAQFISFVVSIFLARLLSPNEYGIVALVMIFINLADVLVTSGLGTSLVQKKKADELDFSTMNIASVVFSISVYLVLFICSPIISKIYNNSTLTAVLRVLGIKIIIAAINSIQQAYVQRKMIYKKFFFATLIGTIISAVVGIVMAKKGYGVWALVAQYMTNSTIDTIILFFSIDWKPKLHFSWKRFKKLFEFGSKVMLSSFIGCLFEQLRGLLVGLRYSSQDLAFNNKGEQLPVMIYSNINSTIESVLFSTISKIQDDKIKLKYVVRRMIKTSSYIIMPIMCGLLGISENLIRILLTDKWIESVPFMQIVCIQECFAILNTVNMQAIKAIGKGDTMLKLEVIKKPIYLAIVVSLMFISPLAACIGCCFYYIIAFFINAKPNGKYLNYYIKEQIADTFIYFIISLVMGGLVFIIGKLSINQYLLIIIQIICGLIFYLVTSIIFKLDSYYYVLNIIKEKISKKQIYQ